MVIEKIKRSVRLTPDELKALKKLVKGFETATEACEVLGFSRSTLDRVMFMGSGNPETVAKIRQQINAA